MTAIEAFDKATKLRDLGARHMVDGRYALAEQCYREAAQYALTEAGRAVCLEQANQAAAQRTGAA